LESMLVSETLALFQRHQLLSASLLVHPSLSQSQALLPATPLGVDARL
jgi:hypothetical protein